MSFIPYPSILYHSAGITATVMNDEQRDALLAEGWADSPAVFESDLLTSAVQTARTELIAAAKAKGIKIWRGWSNEQIRAAIDKAV